MSNAPPPASGPAGAGERGGAPLKVLASLLGTAALLGLGLWWAGTGGITTALAALSLQVLLTAFGLQMGVSLMAAWRVHLLLHETVPFRVSLAISLVHTAFLMFAPLRSGELVYVYLVRRVAGREAVRGLSQVVIFRLFDTLALSGLALGLLAWAGTDLLPGGGARLAMVAAALVVAQLVFAGLLVWRGQDLLARLASVAEIRGRLGARVAGWSRAAALELGIGRRGALMQLLASLAIWALVLTSAWVVMSGVGVTLPPAQVCAVLAVQRFLLAVPIPALGTFGPSEVTFTAMAAPLGVPRELALAAILVQHSLVAGFAVLLGALAGGWLVLRGFGRARE